jgi:hypothetical protein
MGKQDDLAKKSLAWTIFSVGLALMMTSILLFLQITLPAFQYWITWLAAIVFFILAFKVFKVAMNILYQTKHSN